LHRDDRCERLLALVLLVHLLLVQDCVRQQQV
jgi:hypothetical protein